MRRQLNGLAVEAGTKPIGDLPAKRHAIDAADPTVTFVRGIRHETSNLLGKVNRSKRYSTTASHDALEIRESVDNNLEAKWFHGALHYLQAREPSVGAVCGNNRIIANWKLRTSKS